MEWRWERWGEPTKTADRGWNGPFYGLVSRIPPVHAKKQGAKPDRLLAGPPPLDGIRHVPPPVVSLDGALDSLAQGPAVQDCWRLRAIQPD